jgi:hypothetical protein
MIEVLEGKRIGETSGILKFGSGGSCTVLAAVEFLDRLSKVYQNAMLWKSLNSREGLQPGLKQLIRGTLREDDPAAVRSRVDKLVLSAVEIHSPGFWEFLGALSPLKFIRDILIDMHERKKDRLYKMAAEAQKLELDNEYRRLEVEEKAMMIAKMEKEAFREEMVNVVLKHNVIASRVRLLRDMGMTDDEISRYVKEALSDPMVDLLSAMEAANVSDPSLRVQA